MAQHFYDNQIRRYLLQVTRMLSNFYWENGDGALKQIPVAYGDPSRQVAALIAQNSEASMPSVPRIAAYITGLQIDNNRRADPMFIDKRHIRERRYDSAGNEYLEAEGKNYTVERLMPTPYTLSHVHNADESAYWLTPHHRSSGSGLRFRCPNAPQDKSVHRRESNPARLDVDQGCSLPK